MENRGLLFIPDISGFTRFVNEIEIDHSRFIIQQLLEAIINANESGLEISEIEGDAILFYKFGEPLRLEEVYKQVEKMFRAFHKHLIIYDHRKICQCKACVSAVNLTLKIITHYGEFTTYNIKQFNKLIGKDVIVAHKLLKNDIVQHEYWLVTNNLLQGREPTELAQWMQWNTSNQKTEMGEINFHYTQLSPLKNEISDDSPQLEISEKVKVLSVSRDYNVDVKTLCYTVVHFEFRHLWFGEIKAIDEVEHFLPGVGTRHRHVLANGKVVMMYISNFVYNPEAKTIFSETDEKKKTSVSFVVERTAEHNSKLTLELYLPPNKIRQFFFGLFKKNKKEQEFSQSLHRLDKVVQEMVVPLEF